ncbi:MAG: response regulator, partial [Methanomassiliicoccales archaeon]|nr:response regulator [Methanomassiliicoccales archaeon]
MNYEEPGKKRLEVLYVDDEIHMRDSFKQFMEYQFDVNVKAAPSPLIAFDMMKEKEFDAIVSDYQMPEMDGLEFLRKLRSSGSDIPFILFTGRGREEVVIEALNSGADYYMQKGGNPSSLFAELNYYLKLSVEKRRKERQIALTNERLESLIENMSDAFALFDLKGHIISINGAFEKTYGWSANEAAGMELPMVPQEEMNAAKQRFEDVVASGKAIHYT